MHFIATIAERAAEAGLPFLLIGGNAVIAYGYPRQTADWDFLVRDTDRDKWHELILPLGFRLHHHHLVFHMYHPLQPGLVDMDLMLVDGGTFAKLQAESHETTISGVVLRMPSLRHLIALKLHALRAGLEHRRERDLLDIIMLVQLNKVDLAAPEFVQILDRYATPAIRAELLRRLAGPESAGA